jgi:hypothetical protein
MPGEFAEQIQVAYNKTRAKPTASARIRGPSKAATATAIR